MTSFTKLFGVLILVFAVFGGVYLAKQEQDITNKAEESKEHKVTLCHKTGSESNPWEQIELSESALNAHLGHGDIQGNCPSSGGGDHGKGDKNEDQAMDKKETGAGGINLPTTNVVVVNQSVSAPQPTPETKYIYVTTRVDFWIKFQGINEKKKDKSVRVIFRGQDELHVYNKVIVTSNDKGVYRGTISDIRPGKYDVLIKGDAHLQKKFEGITIAKGANEYYWNKEELLVGDFDSDNTLALKDVAEILSFYKADINPVQEGFEVFDLDLSGFVDSDDIKLVLDNFKQLTIGGDE